MQKRLMWLDSLKGIAVFFVIFGHILLGFIENNAFPSVQDNLIAIKDWIYTWHMPLFMSISGYAFRIGYIRNDIVCKNKVCTQVLNLSVVYIVFQAALCFLKVFFFEYVDNKQDFFSACLNIIYPNTLMWYLWVLIIYYIISVLCYQYEVNVKHTSCLLVIIAILGRIIDAAVGMGVCFRGLTFCAIFFFGGIQFDRLKKYLYTHKMIGLFVVYSVFFVVLQSLIFEKLGWIRFGLELMNAVAISTLLFYLVEHIHFLKCSKILAYFGKNSLIVYLLHTYIVTACKVLVIRMGIGSAGYVIFSVFVITLLACCSAIEIISKVGFLSSLFHPIKGGVKDRN